MGHDGYSTARCFDVNISERLVHRHVQQHIGGVVHRRHLFGADDLSYVSVAEQLMTKLIDFGSQRPIAEDCDCDAWNLCCCAQPSLNALAFDKCTNHYYEWAFRQAKRRTVGSHRLKTFRIDTVGDERCVPIFFVAFEVHRVCAHEAFAGKQFVFRVVSKRWPITVLGHKQSWRPLLPRTSEGPVFERIPTRHCVVGFVRIKGSEQPRGKKHAANVSFGPKRRNLRPPLKLPVVDRLLLYICVLAGWVVRA